MSVEFDAQAARFDYERFWAACGRIRGCTRHANLVARTDESISLTAGRSRIASSQRPQWFQRGISRAPISDFINLPVTVRRSGTTWMVSAVWIL